MNESKLKELLRRADFSVASSGDVVEGVLRRRRVKERGRRVMGLIAVVMIGTGVAVQMRDGGGSRVELSSEKANGEHRTSNIEHRTEDMEPGVSQWLAVARRVEIGERLGRARAVTESGLAGVLVERERAAEVMLRQGDWQRAQGGSGEREYRAAVELFDGTRGAAEARGRLGAG